ncbi:Hypothetical predicted protein [Mytilus galloprovincialis]|uniref:Ig-like domain-containing protein n=1 Tax=Mytilus galloprovincialis TaxID=29158 RepID=A0A8B6BN28_MYTGA|nr:Hypothetical predicted protein [Mytilus galloprovincialis]
MLAQFCEQKIKTSMSVRMTGFVHVTALSECKVKEESKSTVMLFKLMTLVHLCAAFPLKCPEAAQWRLRANSHCADSSKYSCLWDDNIKEYSENCTRFDFQNAGRKSVLRGGIDADECSKERYQPSGYTLYTNASTNCILLKSFCNEEGQVVYDHGNRTTDATCICNYRRGFAFLIKPNNPCYCKPSQEDCSCFLKICSNSSHILSPDYKCTINSDLHPVTHCRAITDENDNSGRKPDVKETFLKEDNVSVFVLEPWKERSVNAILSFSAFENNGPEPELNLIEGDTLILQYMLPIKRLRLCFFKDDTLIAETVNVKKHVLEKTNVTLGDQGNYFAKVCKIRSRITKVTVQSMFTSEFNTIKCIEGEKLQFKCSVYSIDINVELSKVDAKDKQIGNITMQRDGKDHCMTIQQAQLSDAGQYMMVAGNVQKPVTVTVAAMYTSEFRPMKCIEGETLQLKCSVYSEDINIEWYKDDTKVKQNKNISIEIDGKDHCMTIQQAKLSDAGQYMVSAGNVEKQVTVTVEVLPEAINRLPEKYRTRYIELMQSTEVEKRYFVRIMIVGKETVGKTSLVRRLLKEEKIDDVNSTDGLDIVVHRCKINIDDGKWMIGNFTFDDRGDRIHRAVNKESLKNYMPTNISHEQSNTSSVIASTDEFKHIEVQVKNRNDISDTATLSDLETSTPMLKKKNEHLMDEEDSCLDNASLATKDTKDTDQTLENIGKIEDEGNIKDDENDINNDTKDISIENKVTKKSLALVKPLDLMSHVFSKTATSNIPSSHYALCGLWDFAGQKDFYATHQTFLTSSAIYLVVADMADEIFREGRKHCFEDFQNVGEYVDFWFDTIHCHRTIEPRVNESSIDHIDPPVILVLTGKDKYKKDEEKKRKNDLQTQLDKVLGYQSKYHHLRSIFCLSNTTDPYNEFEKLQDEISTKVREMKTWGETMPLKWILLEHLIEINKDNGKNFINLSEMADLAKHSSINILDIEDVKLFLCFQHEVGSLIYFEDIPDFIILKPKWLVDAFRCLVSDRIDDKLQHRTDSTKFVQNGQISESLILELFKSKCESQFSDQIGNLVRVMEKFDILVKVDKTSSYIVPSMMPFLPFSEVCNLVGLENQNKCKRTSWLCLKFTFLPPAFFNHVSVWFIKKYSKPENQKQSMMLFRGICVLDIDQSGCKKLLVTMSTDIIAIQLLSFSTGKTDFINRCSNIYEDLIEQVQAITKRYRMTIFYEPHFKCSSGQYFKDTISYKDLKSSTDLEYLCLQHKEPHQCKEIYLPWMNNAEKIWQDYKDLLHHDMHFLTEELTQWLSDCDKTISENLQEAQINLDKIKAMLERISGMKQTLNNTAKRCGILGVNIDNLSNEEAQEEINDNRLAEKIDDKFKVTTDELEKRMDSIRDTILQLELVDKRRSDVDSSLPIKKKESKQIEETPVKPHANDAVIEQHNLRVRV